MSETKRNENKVLKFISEKVNIICFLSYVVGIIWFLALSLRDLGEATLTSENALLPGMQESHFGWSEERKAQEYNNELSKYDHMSQLQGRIAEIMQDSGILLHKQPFQSKSPIPEKKNGNVIFKTENGTNLYAIIRAGRSSSTESIVLNVPLSSDHFNYALGIILAFGRQIRAQPYWAKDVILLFSEKGYVGSQAWLQSYYDTQNSEFIQSSMLLERAGTIVGALVLELKDVTSFLNVNIVGNNGQLPNLDLYNVFIKLAKVHGIRVAMNGELTNNFYNPMSVDGYLESLRTTVRMISKQACGFSKGNHAMFLQHNIHSMLIEGMKDEHKRSIDPGTIGRITEGICRSLNNLLEKLHHSVSFYLLSATDRYISIGLYMPPLGLIILAPTLKALCLWIGLVKQDKEKMNEALESDDHAIEDILEDMDSSILPEKNYLRNNPWIQLSAVLSMVYLSGIGLYFSPKFAVAWSEMFHLTTSHSLVLIFLSAYGVGMILPCTSLISMTEDSDVWTLLRILALVIHAGTIGCVSVINFSLGLVLAVITVPLITPITHESGKFQIFQILMAFFSTPITVFLILNFLQQVYFGEELEFRQTSESAFREIYEQFVLGNTWIYPFTCLLLYPNWLLFWILSLAKITLNKT